MELDGNSQQVLGRDGDERGEEAALAGLEHGRLAGHCGALLLRVCLWGMGGGGRSSMAWFQGRHEGGVLLCVVELRLGTQMNITHGK